MAWGAAAELSRRPASPGDAVYVADRRAYLNAVMSLLHAAGPTLWLIGGLALLYLAFDRAWLAVAEKRSFARTKARPRCMSARSA